MKYVGRHNEQEIQCLRISDNQYIFYVSHVYLKLYEQLIKGIVNYHSTSNQLIHFHHIKIVQFIVMILV